jgi:hypothetical protein
LFWDIINYCGYCIILLSKCIKLAHTHTHLQTWQNISRVARQIRHSWTCTTEPRALVQPSLKGSQGAQNFLRADDVASLLTSDPCLFPWIWGAPI